MEEPIEELYFNWLCAKVLSPDTPVYVDLLRIMHSTEFVWTIAGDKNRAEDGLELRDDFLSELRIDADSDWYYQAPSIFEVLYAFAKKACFQTDRPTRDWFWNFVVNLGLDDFKRVHPDDVPVIEESLYIFVWRTYRENGHGGLFPMRKATQDQREVEIWYQFCDYLVDQGLV